MQVQRGTLADQVAFRLVQRIESEGLRPGDALPPVAYLAEQFGVSRLVVREAIRTLSAREILVASQGRQARVAMPSAAVLGQIIEFRLRQRSLNLADLFDLRELIESEAARLAAESARAGRADASGAAAALEGVHAASDRETFMRRDVEFHDAIAGMAGNSLLVFILEAFREVLLRARELTYDARSQGGRSHEETIAEHRAILDAIEAGDPAAAADAMRAHIASTVADVGVSTMLPPTSDH